MKNPLGWFKGWLRLGGQATTLDGNLDLSSSDLGVTRGPSSCSLDTAPPTLDPDAIRAELRASLREELASFTQRAEADQRRVREQFAEALTHLRELVGGIETTLSAKIDELGSEISGLRVDVDRRAQELGESHRDLSERCDGLLGKIQTLDQGMEGLVTVVEQHLTATERSLGALKESGERRVHELRESHRRHAESLERSRTEALRIAEKSRDRLESRVEEIAEFLEEDIWPVAPDLDAFAPSFEERPASWKRPLAAAKRWFRRSHHFEEQIASLRDRTTGLERFLRERCEEGRRRGRELRRALAEESEWWESTAHAAAEPQSPAEVVRENVELSLACAGASRTGSSLHKEPSQRERALQAAGSR